MKDIQELAAVESDPNTNQHRPAGPPSQETVEQHLRDFVQDWDEQRVGYWAVEHDGAFIGVAGLRRLTLHDRDCWNLYYRFRPDHWGRGFASEAAREAVVLAHEQDVMLPVVARTRPANLAAKRVAERAGLERRRDLDADGFEVFAIGW